MRLPYPCTVQAVLRDLASEEQAVRVTGRRLGNVLVATGWHDTVGCRVSW